MKRIVLAAAALLALAAPASAQYRGDYYGDRGYGGRYDRDGSYGRRGYDRYEEDDDDYRRRRSRRSEPRREERNEGRGGGRQGGLGEVCVTPRSTCPHPAVPVGTGCGCVTSAGTTMGTIR